MSNEDVSARARTVHLSEATWILAKQGLSGRALHNIKSVADLITMHGFPTGAAARYGMPSHDIAIDLLQFLLEHSTKFYYSHQGIYKLLITI
jgi:hypothetical protein